MEVRQRIICRHPRRCCHCRRYRLAHSRKGKEERRPKINKNSTGMQDGVETYVLTTNSEAPCEVPVDAELAQFREVGLGL